MSMEDHPDNMVAGAFGNSYEGVHESLEELAAKHADEDQTIEDAESPEELAA